MIQPAQIQIPDKLIPVFDKPARYRGAYGGRGSGKTRTFALMTAVKGYQLGVSGRKGIILCAREHLNSLDESSLQEIKEAIDMVPWLKDYYEVGDRFIRSKDNRIHFAFSGLRRNLDSLKSKSKVLIAWIDEAENVGESAWQKLIPTVREHDSEIWVTWNPESKESATHKRFRLNTPKDAIIEELNWQDNPWFPDVLDKARLEDLSKRPEIYQHVWEGDFVVYVEGAFYAPEMLKAKNEGRVMKVPYDHAASVVTAWDLGMADTTAIWFTQTVGYETRVIDYYENSGMALDHYVKILREKDYNYESHILPHDVKVRELTTGKSRLEVLRNLGLNNIHVAPMLGIEDGIQQVRSLLPNCYFDADKCERGIDALMQYHREWDDAGKAWRGRPKHDWTSHAADAFRYLATGNVRRPNTWSKPIRRNLKGIA